MSLVAVRATRARTSGAVGILFAVRRSADDLPSGLGGRQRIAVGKAQIDCERHQIQLWTMFMNMATAGREYPPSGAGVPCPRPAGWSPGNPVVVCSTGANARAVTDEFRVTRARLGGRCAPRAVSLRVTRALSAFNAGLADVFARQFAPRPTLRPQRRALRSRRVITRYALARYDAGEGWTATQLERVGRTARYRLSLSVVHQTKPFGRGTAVVTVHCASGLISSWLGPGVRTPT
jgi:hypothetical protein